VGGLPSNRRPDTLSPPIFIRFTVPVLFDKKTQTIVNNESSEIIRIFNIAFNDLLPEKQARLDLYPKALQTEIDAVNEWVYNDLNSSLYSFQLMSKCP
jgi:putative glutathione S-transferase